MALFTLCQRSFWQRFPGILPRLRATEPFRRSVCHKHFDGISRSRLDQRETISGATVERWFGEHLRRLAAQRASPVCPRILGIDEHFFARRQDFATTFCDLKNHKVYDVVLGRSELSLESYLAKLEGKDKVRWSAWIWLRSTGRLCASTSHMPGSWRTGSMSSGW